MPNWLNLDRTLSISAIATVVLAAGSFSLFVIDMAAISSSYHLSLYHMMCITLTFFAVAAFYFLSMWVNVAMDAKAAALAYDSAHNSAMQHAFYTMIRFGTICLIFWSAWNLLDEENRSLVHLVTTSKPKDFHTLEELAARFTWYVPHIAALVINTDMFAKSSNHLFNLFFYNKRAYTQTGMEMV